MPGWNSLKWLRKSIYGATELETQLGEVLGDQKLRDALKPMMFPAFDLVSSEVVFFSSVDEQYKDCTMKQVCRATSAAPTYFEAAKVLVPQAGQQPGQHLDQELLCVDGGLFANNPVLHGLG